MHKPIIKDKYTIEDLFDILKILRSDTGCPWDRVQTHESMKKNMIEEAYESIDALDSGNDELFANELGDVLLQVAFHSLIAEERSAFNFDKVLYELCTKLISRHTHVFGDVTADNAEDALKTWEENKKKETASQTNSQVLRDVPHHFPALLRAEKIQKKAASFGTSFGDKNTLIEKCRDILGNIEKNENVQESYKKLLFAVTALGKSYDLTPETELSAASAEFISAFSEAENAEKPIENVFFDDFFR